jgi:hypothetical protein
MDAIIPLFLENAVVLNARLEGQKGYADLFYNWEIREEEWASLIRSVKNIPLESSSIEIPEDDGPVFKYSTG